jgi:hypothetical protein
MGGACSGEPYSSNQIAAYQILMQTPTKHRYDNLMRLLYIIHALRLRTPYN